MNNLERTHLFGTVHALCNLIVGKRVNHFV